RTFSVIAPDQDQNKTKLKTLTLAERLGINPKNLKDLLEEIKVRKVDSEATKPYAPDDARDSSYLSYLLRSSHSSPHQTLLRPDKAFLRPLQVTEPRVLLSGK
ncbi:hypothetical protein PTTG_29393, partial [Puccinia triticina 1-1 BBBD Race 1]